MFALINYIKQMHSFYFIGSATKMPRGTIVMNGKLIYKPELYKTEI